MEVKASLNNLRTSPRKVRLVTGLISGMGVMQAQAQLKFLPKRAADPVLKLLNSAIANAENTFKLTKDNLFISKVTVDSGPILKRWLPRAHGRATPLRKRTSHITIVLDERVPATAKVKPQTKAQEKTVMPAQPVGKKDDVTTKPETVEPTEKEQDLDRPFVEEDGKKKDETKKGWQGSTEARPGATQKGIGGITNKIFRRKSF